MAILIEKNTCIILTMADEFNALVVPGAMVRNRPTETIPTGQDAVW
jgi:hypothetical protein